MEVNSFQAMGRGHFAAEGLKVLQVIVDKETIMAE
jgi:hypothetical protein